MGAQLVAQGGSDAQKQAILPAVAEGKMKLAFAHTEPGSRYDLARRSRRKASGGDASRARRARWSARRWPTSWSSRRGRRRASACSSSTRRTWLPKPSGRSTSIAAADIVLPGAKAERPLQGGLALIEEVDRLRHRAGLRRSGRRDEVRLRHDARVPEDAQAVRRADRHLPGAAAPHRRPVHRARAGAARWPASPAPRSTRAENAADRSARGLGGQDQDRRQRAPRQPGSGAAARRHGHERGAEGQPHASAASPCSRSSSATPTTTSQRFASL